MLKKIPVSRVVPGMYIHELCGSWMDHPFWRSGFLLEDRHDLERLQKSSVTEVWIDVSKGVDVPDGETSDEVSERSELVLQQVVSGRTWQSMADELRRAAKICERSKAAVISMFNEVRMGRSINTEQTQQVVSEVTQSVLRHPTRC